jgi:hypothetical protein
LKLNLVAVKSLVKTIVMEKEVFNCYDAKSTLAQVKDVQTFIELVGRGEGGKPSKKGNAHGKPTGHRNDGRKPAGHGTGGGSVGVTALSKSVVADTCIKDLKSGGVSCKSVSVPLGVTRTPLAGCSVTSGKYPFPVVAQPTHPVEMSTTTLDRGLVKTVAVEKEVFDCAGRIGDLYLFTGVVESAQGGAGFHGVRTQFEGVICLKDATTAQLVSCKLFTPTRAA